MRPDAYMQVWMTGSSGFKNVNGFSLKWMSAPCVALPLPLPLALAFPFPLLASSFAAAACSIAIANWGSAKIAGSKGMPWNALGKCRPAPPPLVASAYIAWVFSGESALLPTALN